MMTDSDFLKLQPMFDAIIAWLLNARPARNCRVHHCRPAYGRLPTPSTRRPWCRLCRTWRQCWRARNCQGRSRGESIGQARTGMRRWWQRGPGCTLADANVVELPPVWVSEMPGPCDACGSLRHLTIAHPANEVQQ